MRKIKTWISEIFSPAIYQDLDIPKISESLGDVSTRIIWLDDIMEMIRYLNMEVDRRLLSGNAGDIADLCAKRRAIQDVLEAVLSARNQALGKSRSHNPKVPGINLDRVTA